MKNHCHRQNKSILAVILLLLSTTGCNAPNTPATHSESRQPAPHHDLPASANEIQPFDYYLLNLSWSPEFCHFHRNAPECAAHPAFVLHGLWPQNRNGSYPQNCSTAPGPSNPEDFSDIYPDPGLLEHEWRTHGTCSGLSPEAFFTLARQAFHSITIPPQLAQIDHQISLPPNQIIQLFHQSNPSLPATSLAISCGNNYLTAVEACLDTHGQPTSCGPIRSCRANTVRITPP